ncbi:hypothetical protein JXA40_09935 [bacterium]|nr:hypothetical protein [candidate division CSSED10-310 bacterium]
MERHTVLTLIIAGASVAGAIVQVLVLWSARRNRAKDTTAASDNAGPPEPGPVGTGRSE